MELPPDVKKLISEGLWEEYALSDSLSGKIVKRRFHSIEDAVVYNLEKYNSELIPIMRIGKRWYGYTGE